MTYEDEEDGEDDEDDEEMDIEAILAEEFEVRTRLYCCSTFGSLLRSVVSVIRYISVSISIPLLAMYFNSVSITVLACISVSITVIVNGFDLFQLTDISVSVN